MRNHVVNACVLHMPKILDVAGNKNKSKIVKPGIKTKSKNMQKYMFSEYLHFWYGIKIESKTNQK